MHFRCNISFLALCPMLIIATSRTNAEDTTCYTEIKNASSGVLAVKPESLTQNICTWVIASSFGSLLFTVESVNLETDAFLEVVVDGNRTSLPRQCDNCSLTFSGDVIRIRYKVLNSKNNSKSFLKQKKYLSSSTTTINSSMPTTSDVKKTYLKSNLTILPHVPTKSSSLFIIRYRTLSHLKCDPPSFPVNYLPLSFAGGNSLKLGSGIKYSCSRPYTPAQGSLLSATCVLNSTTSLPVWSNPSPHCVLPECDNSPTQFSLDDNQSSIIFQQETLKVNSAKRCIWEIAVSPKKHLVVQVDRLTFPRRLNEKQMGGVVELFDGKISESRLLARLTENVDTQPQRYSTLFNTLIISLNSEMSTHIVDQLRTNDSENIESIFDIHIIITTELLQCKTPTLLANGDVKGTQLFGDALLNKGSAKNMVIAYSCSSGYNMYGLNHSSCLGNGKWSNPTPSCLPSDSLDENVQPENATLISNGKDISKKDAISSEKFLQSKMPKNRRPHLQSTEEKTNLKTSKEDFNSKTNWEPVITLPIVDSSISENFTTDSDIFQENSGDGNGIVETSGPISPHYPFDENEYNSFSYPDEDGEDPFLDEEQPEEELSDNLSTTWEFPILPVILGVGIPLLLVSIVVGGCLMYRKLYPVRMSVGRRFETFENPIYKDKKRGTASPGGTLLPGLSIPHSPAELQRLTVS